MISRAIMIFGARETVFRSPLRKKIVTALSSLSIPIALPLTSFATIASQFFACSFRSAFCSSWWAVSYTHLTLPTKA
jgi:hypothetical protein